MPRLAEISPAAGGEIAGRRQADGLRVPELHVCSAGDGLGGVELAAGGIGLAGSAMRAGAGLKPAPTSGNRFMLQAPTVGGGRFLEYDSEYCNWLVLTTEGRKCQTR